MPTRPTKLKGERERESERLIVGMVLDTLREEEGEKERVRVCVRDAKGESERER